MPTTDPQKEKARARASPSNECESVASAELSCMAAPTPCIARAAMRTARFGAKPQRKEAKVKTDSPIIRNFLRPNRSASAPAGSSNEAKLNI